jgi:hypothetical protein
MYLHAREDDHALRLCTVALDGAVFLISISEKTGLDC